MKNNLRNKESAQKIIERAQRLQADSPALWGSMSVTEMLHHCNKVHEQLLTPATASSKKTGIKQYVLRWLVLYVLPRFPKNAQAPKALRTKGTINQEEFEKQKTLFAETVNRFATSTNPIAHYHPYFGNLSTEQWGLTSWKHVDHHLRQFGV